MRPKFTYDDLKSLSSGGSKSAKKVNSEEWITPEMIPVKSIYTRDDLKDMEHLDYAAGLPPFLRGPYSGMYAMMPWTIQAVCRIFNC